MAKKKSTQNEPYYIHVDSGVTISADDYRKLTADHKAAFEIDDSEAQDGPHHQLSELYHTGVREGETDLFAMLEKKRDNSEQD